MKLNFINHLRLFTLMILGISAANNAIARDGVQTLNFPPESIQAYNQETLNKIERSPYFEKIRSQLRSFYESTGLLETYALPTPWNNSPIQQSNGTTVEGIGLEHVDINIFDKLFGIYVDEALDSETPILYGFIDHDDENQESTLFEIKRSQIKDWYTEQGLEYKLLRYNCSEIIKKCLFQFNHKRDVNYPDKFIEIDLVTFDYNIEHGFPLDSLFTEKNLEVRPLLQHLDSNRLLVHTLRLNPIPTHEFWIADKETKRITLLDSIKDQQLERLLLNSPDYWSQYRYYANFFLWKFKEDQGKLYFRTNYHSLLTLESGSSENILREFKATDGSIDSTDLCPLINNEPAISTQFLMNPYTIVNGHVAYIAYDGSLSFLNMENQSETKLVIPGTMEQESLIAYGNILVVKYKTSSNQKLGIIKWDSDVKQFVLNEVHIEVPDAIKPFLSFNFYNLNEFSSGRVFVELKAADLYIGWKFLDLKTHTLKLDSPIDENISDFLQAIDVKHYSVLNDDGIEIPFTVYREKIPSTDNSLAKETNKTPTLISVYGGRWSDVAIAPMDIELWVRNGGIFVLAHVRGTPALGHINWEATIKENFHKRVDDVFTVADEILRLKISTQEHLGLRGGSNGGLMATLAGLKRPGFFRAVASISGVYDLVNVRKNQIHGINWTSEYGNADDPMEFDFVANNEPFPHITSEINETEFLLLHSQNDSIVNALNSRKLISAMRSDSGIYNAFYFESESGDHKFFPGTSMEDYVLKSAIYYGFLWESLSSI